MGATPTSQPDVGVFVTILVLALLLLCAVAARSPTAASGGGCAKSRPTTWKPAAATRPTSGAAR